MVRTISVGVLLLAAQLLWAQYVPRSKYDRYFPTTTDPRTNALKHKVRWYDESSMPRAYQIWDGQSTGLRGNLGLKKKR